MNKLRRYLVLSTLVLLAIPLFPNSFHVARAGPIIDPDLTAAINSGSPQVQFIVTYDHQPTSTDVAFLKSLGVKAVVMDQLPMALIIGSPSAAQTMIAQSGILSVWYNSQQQYYAQVKTNNHNYGTVPVSNSWWIDTMNVRPAWNQGVKGQGIGIAIVDSGVDGTNPSLGYNMPASNLPPFGARRVIQNVKVIALTELIFDEPVGPDVLYVENQPNTDTTGGHGTGTSSSAVGTGLASNGVYLGVAPEANIIGLGAGDTIVLFYIISSFNYILAHRVQYNIRVNSNSWGPGSGCESCFSPANPVNVASKKMHDQGITVLFSAGNSGPRPGTMSGYAAQPWVIGVAASQISKGLTTFSSRGYPTNPSRLPSITAPGENIIASKSLTGNTDNSLNAAQDRGNIIPAYYTTYTTFGGTSAASPLTAGAAALVLSANPSLDPDHVKAVLTSTADPMPGYLSFQQGSGHVNAAKAVQFARTGSFTAGTIKVENHGIQAYNLQAYEAFGLEVPLASTPVDNNFPTFTGAQSFTVTVSWTNPSSDHGWNVRLYAPNDISVLRTPLPGGVVSLNGLYSKLGDSSLTFTVSGASTISSYYWPGQSMGTWDVVVYNTQTAEKYQVNVQVQYSQPGTMHLGDGTNGEDSHDVDVDDQGTSDSSGNLEAVFQGYDGKVQGIQALGTRAAGSPLSLTSTLAQPRGQVVQVVQVVIVDSNGNVLQSLDGWVTTQSDIQLRISQVQSALLTATPAQALVLQAELSRLNTALTIAPVTETLPAL